MNNKMGVALFAVLILHFSHQQVSGEVSGCEDADNKCAEWATRGECTSNAVWMMANCRKSCHSCQGGDRAWKLRTHIASAYQNRSENSTRLVRVESVRLNAIEIDEKRQVAKATGRFVLSWNDTMVAWDKDQWGLSWLNFYWIQIWSPQIIQINSGSAGTGSVSGKVLAANYTGQIYLWADFTFTSSFDFDYDDYPNDKQRMCYKFDDKRLFAVQFVVSPEVRNKQHEAVSETHISGWIIDDLSVSESKLSTEALSDWRQNPFDVQSSNGDLCIGLRRNAVFFFSEMFLPAAVAALFTLSAAFFHLSRTQAVLLAFSIITQLLSLILISQRLPDFTTTTPSILKFSAFNMSSTAFLFIVSLLLERLASTPTELPPPHSLDSLATLVNTLLPLPRRTKHEDESLHWAAAAHALNHAIFALAAFCYLIAFVAFFVL